MNKAEEIVIEKYKKGGFKCLHNRGLPDCVFFRVVDNTPTDIMFVEVKTPTDKLSYEQSVFKKIAHILNLNYKIEVVK